MTSLSYPPRPVPHEEGRTEQSPRRVQGERRVSRRPDPFGGEYTPDPFAPKSRSGRLPKIDPLMPTKQAERLKRQWEEQRAIEEAQRRAQEHKRRLAKEEAQRRAELEAKERAERRAREKAELDFQRWSAERRALEERKANALRQRREHQEAQARRQAEEEARAGVERERLEAWRQEQLYAREQALLDAQKAAQANAEAKRKPGSFIPPPDAWRASQPSAPPYGMSPTAQSRPHSETGAIVSRSYSEQGVGPLPERSRANPKEATGEVSAREAELIRLVKLQVEAISELKGSLEELSSRQRLLEQRDLVQERSREALQQVAHSVKGSAYTQTSAQGEGQPSAQIEPQASPKPPGDVRPEQEAPPPVVALPSRLSAVHDELSAMQAPKGIFARLSSGLRRIVSGLEEDPWSELVTHAPSAIPPVQDDQGTDHAPQADSSERHPITFQQGPPSEERAGSEATQAQASGSSEHPTMSEERSDSGGYASAPIIQFSQGAFEETVGGVTVSKAPQMGQDGPLYPILLQQAQLIKQHSVTIQTLTQRVSQLEGSLKAQGTDLKSQLKKLTKSVDRAEHKADGAQQQKMRVKSHQRRISQLEVMIEGLEGKIAIFEDRLNSDGQGPATDLRVSPEPGVGDYTSIQDAINDAPVGAYIGVMPGLYTDPLEITKPVKLIGLGKPNEILIQVPADSAIMVNRMGGQYEEAISHTQELEARKRLQQHTTHVAEPSRAGGILKWFKQRLWNEPEVDDRGIFEVETGSDEVSIVGVSINSVTEVVGGVPSDHPTISVRSGHLRLEKCEVRGENGVGVLVEGENAQVTLRACRVVNTRGSAVRLRTRAMATLSGTRIIKSKESGIDAQGFTSVRLMDCEIANHQRIGVHVGFKSQLIAYQCVISGNSFEGVWMNNQSTGSIRSCDMRGNARGPYDISPDCKVELGGNKP